MCSIERRIRVICIFVLSLLMAISITPSVAYASEAVQLEVTQEFVTSAQTADNTFRYVLEPFEPTHPMPETGISANNRFTISGSRSVTLGPIDFTKAGVFQYRLFQIVSAEETGYAYDRQVFTIQVYAEPGKKPQLVILDEDNLKVSEMVFVNSYGDTPSPTVSPTPTISPTPSATPSATQTHKVVTGGTVIEQSLPVPALAAIALLLTAGSVLLVLRLSPKKGSHRRDRRNINA